jgi:hypothetical protein
MSRDVYSEEARAVLDFLYRFWAAERRPPETRDVVLGTGLGFREIRRAYRELQQGFALVFDDQSLNLGLAKVTPFSATPTPVRLEHEGHFHSYLGCPAEALTVGCMPMFCDYVLTVKGSCSCCYEPIELQVKGDDVLSAAPREPLIAFLASPYDWEDGVPADKVCDAIRFVLDGDHAKRLERQTGRRAVLLTFAQLGTLSQPIGKARMWDPHWPPMRVDGQVMVDALTHVGVDVTPWR